MKPNFKFMSGYDGNTININLHFETIPGAEWVGDIALYDDINVEYELDHILNQENRDEMDRQIFDGIFASLKNNFKTFKFL